MLFRRGRLSAKRARHALMELFDQHYQWSLRAPIVHFLAQGDPLRFFYSLRLLIDQVGHGVYLLNRKPPSERDPRFGQGLYTIIAGQPVRPANLVERLDQVMCLDNPVAGEAEIRRLMLEIINLAPKDKKQGRGKNEPPTVSWLSKIANSDTPVQPPPAPKDAPQDLRHVARRAVRIVWRLPGSRLAAITDAGITGFAGTASDIDICLFGLKLPDAGVRRSLIGATSSAPDDITQLTTKRYAADAFWLRDNPPNGRLRLIDVRYFLIEEAQRMIENPVPESRADRELLAHLSTADILVDYESRGPELLDDLKLATHQIQFKRITKTSSRLDQALGHLEASHDSPSIFWATGDAVLALFQILAALNDQWTVFPKRTAAWLNGLELVPADVHQRLGQVVLLPCRPENVDAKVRTLRALAHEIKALCAA